MKCPRCGNSVDLDYTSKCPSCGLDVVAAQDSHKGIKRDSSPVTGSTSHSTDFGSGAISVLIFFAWLDLIGGILIAVYVWVKFGLSDPINFAIALAFVAQGIFTWALFLVVASMAENLIGIRNNTSKLSRS